MQHLLTHFTLLQWTLMLLITALGGLMHGFVGIGLPLLATPLFALIFGFRLAVVLLVIPTLAITVCTLIAYRKGADPREAFRRYWPLLVMAPIGMVAGVQALYSFDPKILMVLLALVVILYLAMDRLGRINKAGFQHHAFAWGFLFGLFAGASEGAVNVSGPALLIYFLLLDAPVASIIATMNYLFFFGKAWQSVLLWQREAFTEPVLVSALPITIVAAGMFYLGLNLRQRFDPSRYRVWLKWTLAAMVVILLVRAVF